MHLVLAKTFGGLSPQYYFRRFLFGLLFPVFLYGMTRQGEHPISLSLLTLMVLSTLLYPYARFVYEGIVGFILGNTFFVNAFLMLVMKLVTMMLCWAFAIFIAPNGLAYLYYHHSKNN